MTEPLDVLEIVRQWVRKADADLLNASTMLRLDDQCPTDTVCFHAQQCVEKCLKACLVRAGIRFPRHHDIGELIALLPPGCSLGLAPEEQERLTDYRSERLNTVSGGAHGARKRAKRSTAGSSRPASIAAIRIAWASSARPPSYSTRARARTAS